MRAIELRSFRTLALDSVSLLEPRILRSQSPTAANDSAPLKPLGIARARPLKHREGQDSRRSIERDANEAIWRRRASRSSSDMATSELARTIRSRQRHTCEGSCVAQVVLV